MTMKTMLLTNLAQEKQSSRCSKYEGSGAYKGSFVTVRPLTVGILLSFFMLDASCMDITVVAMQAINHLNVFFDGFSTGLKWKI
jgi:hypothetical protein